MSGSRRSVSRDLERYAGLFAERTKSMRSSAMRDMMAITSRSEVISLASGNADTSAFPAENLAALMSRVAADSAARALQYGPTEGMPEIKACIAEVMAAEGMEVEEDDLLVTTGGQQVLDLVGRAFIDPGDVIIAEGPTYPGAVPVFDSYQASVVQIEMDDAGMRIDLLEAELERLAAEGRAPKFIYTIPTFQNPGGMTLALDRRRRLVKIAAERELLILEDNPYGLLRYEGTPLPTLRALDGGEYVIYLGTFSKILSPGLRIGWANAPAPILEKLNIGKQAGDLCSPTINQLFVAEYFRQHDWRTYITRVSEIYRRKRDVMLAALAEFFPPEARWTTPEGGMFVWATLPDYIDTTDLLARALQENVAFVPGRAAYVDGRGGSEMRLNFSSSSDEDVREGIKRIGRVIREQVGLYGSLTGSSPAAPASQASASEPPAWESGMDHRSDVSRETSAADPEQPAPGARVVPMRRRAAG